MKKVVNRFGNKASGMLLGSLLGALLSVTAGVHAADEIPQAVSDQLQQMVPGNTPSEVSLTPIPDLYLVRFGTTVLYLSADGKYLFDGQMLDLEARKNLTNEAISKARVDILEGMDESAMVLFTPSETKRTLTIFSDIDCPYCVRLHAERETLLSAGVKLRYILYPRTGINSPSYHKAVSVWCAEDRAAAMTQAKAGMPPEDKVCENPIASQMELASAFGLKGTPHIVIDDGDVIGGYMPAKKLLQKLGL
ncbi:MAG: DsbC family protein [Gammaproteobacteria bacterium]|jgi:thiol:disulfide interchange protein DsbC|nr:DsbC family protein [Gammaproteobacteria bacterium]MBT7307356.1 DsbC family protein [Gammaproteobacteria bacterium]